MAVLDNSPGLKYIRVENLVITFNDTMYPIKNIWTKKKFLYWDSSFPFILQESDVRPKETLSRFLIYINDNGFHKEIPNDAIKLIDGNKAGIIDPTSNKVLNAMKEDLSDTKQKYITMTETIDGITLVIGESEKLDDSIVNKLASLKTTADGLTGRIEKVETSINDDYKEIRSKIVDALAQYTFKSANHKEAITAIQLNKDISQENKDFVNKQLGEFKAVSVVINSALEELSTILTTKGDTINVEIIQNAITTLNEKEKIYLDYADTLMQKTQINTDDISMLLQHYNNLNNHVIATQATVDEMITLDLGDAFLKLTHDIVLANDRFNQTLKELKKEDGLLSEKYNLLEKTVEGTTETISKIEKTLEQVTTDVGDVVEENKTNVASVKRMYAKSSSNIKLVGFDFKGVKKGDLIFWGNKENGRYKGIWHVGIYYGTDTDGVERVIECTSGSGVKLHTDGKTMGLVLSTWEKKNKKDIVCIARPHSTPTNKVFSGADAFVALAKKYYDLRDKYITYGQLNITSDNYTRKWSEVTIKGTDSTDGLYRFLDCSGFVNLALRGISFEEVLQSKSIYDNKDMSPRTDKFSWAYGLPRLASDQCQHVEELGWNLPIEDWHSDSFNWVETPTAIDVKDGYIWEKTVTYYKDGTTHESLPICLTDSQINGDKQIVNSTEYYYESDSNIELVGGQWSTNVPSYEGDKYIWQKTLFLYSDDTSDWTSERCVSGISPRLLELISDSQVVPFNADGNPKSQTPITLTVLQRNYTENITWTVTPSSVSLSGNATQKQLLVDNFRTIDRISVKVTSGDLSDEVVICKVQDGLIGGDGEDAYTVLLTNSSHTFLGNDSTTVDGTTSCGVIAYKGTTQVNTTVGDIINIPIGMSVEVVNNGTMNTKLNISVTSSLTNKNGTVTIPIVVDGKNFEQVFSFAIAFDGTDGVSITDTTLEYGISNSPSVKPTQWTTEYQPSVRGQFIWSRLRTDFSNGNYIYSNEACISGMDGLQGIPGNDGLDGETSYFHIKYSSVENPTSEQMTETPSTYIGTYVDYIKEDSNDPTKYTWSRFMGMQGEQGIPGINGANGVSSYLHTKYSNDGGITFTSNNGEDVGTYLGTCVDNNPTDPSTPSSYKWSKIEGSEIVEMKSQYYLSTSKTQRPSESDSGWKDVCPTWEMGKYIWTRIKITHANPTSVEYTGHYVDTSWEAVNELQISDRNLITNSDFYITANNVTNVNDISTSSMVDDFINLWSNNIGKNITLSVEVTATNALGIEGDVSKRLGMELSIVYEDNTSGYLGCWKWLTSGTPSNWDGERITSSIVIPNKKIKSITRVGIYVQGLASGTAKVGRPKIQISDKATGWTPASEDMDDKINNIQVGGKNLLLNTGFLTTDYWRPNNSTITVHDTPNSPTGKCIKCVASQSPQGFYQYYTPKELGEYTISFWGRADSQLPFYFCQEPSVRKNITLTTTWQKFTHTFTRDTLNQGAYVFYPLDGGTFYIHSLKVEKGNKATDWTPSQEDIDKEITDISNALTNLESGVKSAFGDGIINDSEAKALETHIQMLRNEKLDIDKEYLAVYNNSSLSSGTVKTNLYNSKVAFDSANTALINTINSSISDKIITSTERTNVDNGFTTYRNATSTYKQRLQEALDYIGSKKIDDVQIGGRNILRESGNFKGSLSGEYWTDNGGGIVIDSSITYEGYDTIKTTVGMGIRYPWIQLENNVEYTYSVMVMCNETFEGGATTPLHYWAGKDEVSQGKLTIISRDTSYTEPNVWKKIYITFKLNGDANSFKPMIYFGTLVTKTFNIANIKLEKGNKPTDWSPSLEDITSQINRMNLQRNSTFKRDLSWWTVASGYTRDTSKLFENHYTVKYNISGSTSDSIRYLFSGSKNISAEIGKPYSASCWFYTENKATIDSGGVRLAMFFYDSSGATVTLKETTVTFVNGQWIRVKLENIIAPPNTSYVAFVVSTRRNGVYWLANPKLEQGNTCSDWSESPIDIENEFTKITDDIVTVDKKADAITSLVGKNTRFGRIRYIRDYLKGSDVNTEGHWVEIQAYKDGVNVAKGKPVSASGAEVSGHPLTLITDDSINSGYCSISGVIADGDYKGWKYVQIDLGQVYTDINKIKVWHYYSDRRSYNHTLEVSENGNDWYSLFDSTKQGTYAEKPEGKTYIIDGTYSESQIDQTSDKISWVVKNGTSASNMVLTPELYSVLTENIRLTAKNITIEGLVTANSNFKILTDGSMEAKNGKFSGSITASDININNKFKVASSGDVTCSNIAITGGSINLNSGKFIVSSSGATQIGGMSAVTYDGSKRAICEITNDGAIYSCNPTNKAIFTRIKDGAVMIHTSDQLYINIDEVGLRVWDTTSGFATVYGDAYIGHNTSIMVDAPGLNVNGWVNATKYEGQNHTILRASTDKGVYLCCNGGDYGDNEDTIGVRSIIFFKNSGDDYVFRSRSKTGACYLGTSTYSWGQVCGREFKNTSDRTLKENIVYLSNAQTMDLDTVNVDDMYVFVKNDLPLALYNYIGNADKKIGFIAQDIIYNEDQSDNVVGQLIVDPKKYEEENGKLTYDLNNYVSVVAGALQKTIQVQETEISERFRMQKEIEALKKETETLKSRLDNMGI